MNKLIVTLITYLMFLSPSMVLSETWNDLVERDGLYYKKFSEVPFTGEVTGNEESLITGQVKGLIKNGKREGSWVVYYDSGQLHRKESYKNGEWHGPWMGHWENGQFWFKGNYKKGKLEGIWIYYWDNGQLKYKGAFQNGEQEGRWLEYERDGTLIKQKSGIFRNGKKVSD